MFASPTTYRAGTGVVEVLPGESHSAAWVYVMRGGAFPERYPRSDDPGRVRRRMHTSQRRRTHRRGVPAPVA